MSDHKHHAGISLDLHALGRHPGEMIERHMQIDAPPDMAVGMIGVPEGSPVDMELTCQSAGDGVLVQGVATVQLKGQCARCLSTFTKSGSFDLQELYFYPGKGPVDEDFEEEEALFVVDDCVDLDPILRAAVVLGLPFSPLCRDDCAGLCPTCGTDLNAHPDHAHEAPIDARWAKLKDISGSQTRG